MDRYNHVTCFSCDFETIVYHDEIEECPECEAEVVNTEFNDVINADVIIQMIEYELENANYHREMDLLYPLYEELKIKENDTDTARKIAKVFYNYI